MGGVVDAIFGSGGDDIEGVNPAANVALFPSAQSHVLRGLENFSTGFSTLDPRTGAISIDPTGRNLNLSGLSEYLTRTGETRSGLTGNQGAFMNARVAPLLEQLVRGRGERVRGLSRTGVRGTLRDRDLLDYDIAAGRTLGDARSIATQESLNAISQLDSAMFNAMTGVGTNIFNQQLSELGLSVDAITALKSIASNLATGSASTAATASAAAAEADQARQDNILATFGTILSLL